MPIGYTVVSASYFKDSTGAVIKNATIYFKPNTSFRDGSETPGPAARKTVKATVRDGAFSIPLADTKLTNPINTSYKVWAIDKFTGEDLLGPGYENVQPNGPTWSFDTYNPNVAPQSPLTIVDGLFPRGVYDGDTIYNLGDVVRLGVAVYVSLTNNNSHPLTAGENDSFWMLLVKDGLSAGGGTDPVANVTLLDTVTGLPVTLTITSGTPYWTTTS